MEIWCNNFLAGLRACATQQQLSASFTSGLAHGAPQGLHGIFRVTSIFQTIFAVSRVRFWQTAFLRAHVAKNASFDEGTTKNFLLFAFGEAGVEGRGRMFCVFI